MRTQNEWIEIFKTAMRIHTDYSLAKRWRVEQTRIHQYRKGRLKLPFAAVLDIAQSLGIDPVEIIASLELKRARPCDSECIRRAWFDAAVKTVGGRLDESGHGSGYFRRR